MNAWIVMVSGALVTASLAQDSPEVKFYTLEKEYRQTSTLIYQPKNTEALELKQILEDMVSIYGSVYANENSNELYITDVDEKLEDLRAVLERLDVSELRAGNNLRSELVYLEHENVSELSHLVRHKLSDEGTAFEVPYLNALVITDIPSKIAEVKQLLSVLDVPSKHVSIEITIVEFNNEDFSRLGVDVFGWLQGLSIRADMHGENPGDLKNAGSVTLRSRTRPQVPDKNIMPQADREKAYHLTADIAIADLVGFICDNADGSVLASTRVITRNNKEAAISAREIIPYRFPENDEQYQTPQQHAVYAGMSLRVRPVVQEDSLVNLSILPVISDLTGWSPKGMPIVFERSLSTEVKVKNQSVFVLGGLKKREMVTVRRGLPLLKDIPVIQYLFSVRKKALIEREVLIFIRPSMAAGDEVSADNVQRTLDRIESRLRKKD